MAPLASQQRLSIWDRMYEKWGQDYDDGVDEKDLKPPISDRCLLFASNYYADQFLLISHVTDAPPGAHYTLWQNKDNGLVKGFEEIASQFNAKGGNMKNILIYEDVKITEETFKKSWNINV